MMHKSTNIIALSGLAFFLAGLAAFVVLFNVVTLQKRTYVEESIAQAEATEHHRSLLTLLEVLDESKTERDSIISRILKDEDVIDFLALIETLGAEQGAILTTSALTVESLSGDFETLVVDVSVNGSYRSVMQVLRILEHLPYQSSIRNVRLMQKETDEGPAWESTYQVRVTKFVKEKI